MGRQEAAPYAKDYVRGLNRIDPTKLTDLYQSPLLEGLWFRLMSEHDVNCSRTSSLGFKGSVATLRSTMQSTVRSTRRTTQTINSRVMTPLQSLNPLRNFFQTSIMTRH